MRRLPMLLVLVAACTSVKAQTSIQLIIKGENLKKAEIFDLSQKEIREFDYNDTVTAFFSKTTSDAYNIVYSGSDNKRFSEQVWLDTGHVVIHGHVGTDRLIFDTVINSPSYYEQIRFYREFSRMAKTEDSATVNDFLISTMKKYSQSPLYLFIVDAYTDRNQNHPELLIQLKDLIDSFPEKFEWFILYPMVADRVEKILSVATLDIGDYVYKDRKDRIAKITRNDADYYVLDFWFLNCPPCLRDHIEISRELSILKKNRIEIIGISTDRDYKKWIAYLDKHKYSWLNYLEWDGKMITKDLSISSYPAYIIIDKAGKIIATYNSFENVKSRLLPDL